MEVAWRHDANPHAGQNTGKDTPLQAPWSLLKSLHLRRFASHWKSQSSFVLVQRCWLTCVSPPNWFQVFLLKSSKALAIVRQLARLLGKMCKVDLSWTRSHLQRHLVGHLVKVNSCLIVVNFLGDEKNFAPRLWLAGPSCLNVNISCYYLQAQRDRSQFLSFLLIGATQESSCSSCNASFPRMPKHADEVNISSRWKSTCQKNWIDRQCKSALGEGRAPIGGFCASLFSMSPAQSSQQNDTSIYQLFRLLSAFILWVKILQGFRLVGTMGGVCRLWSQHIAVDEPLRSQTCQAMFANHQCVCEPLNIVCEPPARSLRTMTGVCEPNQVSRTGHEPKAGGTNFREWIYTILATIQTPSVWPWRLAGLIRVILLTAKESSGFDWSSISNESNVAALRICNVVFGSALSKHGQWLRVNACTKPFRFNPLCRCSLGEGRAVTGCFCAWLFWLRPAQLSQKVNKTILQYINFFGFSRLASGWQVWFVWCFLLLNRAL